MKTWDFARELALWDPVRVSERKPPSLRSARAYCTHVARSHYENFAVVSFLLPRRLIPHFHAVYAYCRWSDDLADETGGDATHLLDCWRRELLSCYDGEPHHPVTAALRETIRRFDIPPDPFLNLLIAFTLDQHVKRYASFEQLLGYCVNSANPVGRIILYLFECFDETKAALADQVCTGLQLANFWQDVARDLDIGRIYLPEEDRRTFGYSDEDLAARRCTPAFRELMHFEVDRARGFFDRGERLLSLLPARCASMSISLSAAGVRSSAPSNALTTTFWSRRPVVTKMEKLRLLAGAILRAVSGAW